MVKPFTERLPPLNALRAFEAVARHLSLTRAAAELHVTPAAISHQIRLLEELTGRALLVRKPRGIELTDAAREALFHLSAGFERLAEAMRVLRAAPAESTLTVSVAPSFATCWLMPRLYRFLNQRPGVDVRVTARTRQSTAVGGHSQREAALWLADADVAVLLSDGRFPGFHVEQLFALSVTPLASPSLLGAGKEPAAALRAQVLIHDDIGRAYDGRDYWEMWLEAAGMARVRGFKHGAHFSHTVLALEAAAEGLGVVATLPELAEPQLQAGRLLAPFELRLPLPYGYYAICARERLARAPVRDFIDWLATQRKPAAR
jgi:LysR family transcriptional regulator, glycine cleavage system transcriptional activator